jgi:hypothetical protein
MIVRDLACDWECNVKGIRGLFYCWVFLMYSPATFIDSPDTFIDSPDTSIDSPATEPGSSKLHVFGFSWLPAQGREIEEKVSQLDKRRKWVNENSNPTIKLGLLSRQLHRQQSCYRQQPHCQQSCYLLQRQIPCLLVR